MITILLSDLWDFCKSYGVRILVTIALSILTIYRREISCNNIYHNTNHKNEVTAARTPSEVSRSVNDPPKRRSMGIHGPSRQLQRESEGEGIPASEVDQWLLLEHCCYGVAFGPLFSLTIDFDLVASFVAVMRGILPAEQIMQRCDAY